MIVRRLNELTEDRKVQAENWASRRLLLRSDQMGFSLHDTIIRRRLDADLLSQPSRSGVLHRRQGHGGTRRHGRDHPDRSGDRVRARSP